MLKLISELILALAVLFLPSAPAAEPATADAGIAAEPVDVCTVSYEMGDTEQIYSYQEEGVMLARFENILNHNHCFGKDFSSYEALVLGAEISLLSEEENGFISADKIDAFIFNMYGKQPEEVSFEGFESREGFYPVIPRGYDVYSHAVTDYSYLGDGRIAVESEVIINGACEEKAHCESILFADGSSAFGYILLSSEMRFN